VSGRRAQFGIALPNFSLYAASNIARKAETTRFDSVWVNDDLVGVFQRETFDPLLCAAEMARATKRIIIGTAVLATYRRHPVNVSQSILSLDHLSGGRFIAGLGSCCPAPEWGFPRVADVAERFIEFIEVTRRLLRGGGVDFQGKYFSLRAPGLPVRPRKRPSPPLWAAANVESSIRSIARIADGWLPICVPPKVYSSELEVLLDAARSGGRRGREIVRGCMAFIVISTSRANAVKRGLHILAQTAMWFGASRLRKIGIRPARSVSDVTHEMVRALNIIGSIEDAAERISEYLDAGVRHLILQPLPVKDIPKSIELISEAIEQAA